MPKKLRSQDVNPKDTTENAIQKIEDSSPDRPKKNTVNSSSLDADNLAAVNPGPINPDPINPDPIHVGSINLDSINPVSSNLGSIELDLMKHYSENACKAVNQDMAMWERFHAPLVCAPQYLRFAYFSYIEHYQFNPLYRDILLLEKPDQSWRVIITADGWSRFMNRHPQFRGIEFRESPDGGNTLPTWVECSIYRSDRCQPITIREHYQEVRGEHYLWAQMPRRMLRHQALSQCARLAFGVANLEQVAPYLGEADDVVGPQIRSERASVDFRKATAVSPKGAELLKKQLERSG
jgi:hypothetical protein